MALIMKYEAETGNDVFTPMAVANAIATSEAFTEAELREIADALYARTRTIRENRECRRVTDPLF